MTIEFKDLGNIESFYGNMIENRESFNPCDEDAIVRCEYCDKPIDDCECYSPCCGAYMGGGNGDGCFKDYGICPECGEHV